MRPHFYPAFVFHSLAVGALVALITGCVAESPVVPVPGSAAAGGPRASAQANANPADPDSALARDAADQAGVLAAAMQQPGATATVPPPEVHWIDASGSQQHNVSVVPASNSEPPSVLTTLAGMAQQASATPAPQALAAADVSSSDTVASGGEGDLLRQSRRQLLDTLLKTIYVSDSPELAKAVDAATLAALDPRRDEVNPAFLTGLDFQQIEQVRRYRQVIWLLSQAVSTNSQSGTLDRDAVLAQLNTLFGEQPLSIRKLLLCKRVRGYGAYEAFPDTSFLAGREQRAILYVELDQFRSLDDGSGQYETKLSQEVVLYNEADGLAVWKQAPVDILDRCANPRRDFFVVQLVTLPARLTVGKYLLKVRVTDLHGGSMDEITQPIQIVADQGLVKLDAAK